MNISLPKLSFHSCWLWRRNERLSLFRAWSKDSVDQEQYERYSDVIIRQEKMKALTLKGRHSYPFLKRERHYKAFSPTLTTQTVSPLWKAQHIATWRQWKKSCEIFFQDSRPIRLSSSEFSRVESGVEATGKDIIKKISFPLSLQSTSNPTFGGASLILRISISSCNYRENSFSQCCMFLRYRILILHVAGTALLEMITQLYETDDLR